MISLISERTRTGISVHPCRVVTRHTRRVVTRHTRRIVTRHTHRVVTRYTRRIFHQCNLPPIASTMFILDARQAGMPALSRLSTKQNSKAQRKVER